MGRKCGPCGPCGPMTFALVRPHGQYDDLHMRFVMVNCSAKVIPSQRLLLVFWTLTLATESEIRRSRRSWVTLPGLLFGISSRATASDCSQTLGYVQLNDG